MKIVVKDSNRLKRINKMKEVKDWNINSQKLLNKKPALNGDLFEKKSYTEAGLMA